MLTAYAAGGLEGKKGAADKRNPDGDKGGGDNGRNEVHLLIRIDRWMHI
jgi:hypothetical protein